MDNTNRIITKVEGIVSIKELRAVIKESNDEFLKLPITAREQQAAQGKLISQMKDQLADMTRVTQSSNAQMMGSYFRTGESIRTNLNLSREANVTIRRLGEGFQYLITNPKMAAVELDRVAREFSILAQNSGGVSAAFKILMMQMASPSGILTAAIAASSLAMIFWDKLIPSTKEEDKEAAKLNKTVESLHENMLKLGTETPEDNLKRFQERIEAIDKKINEPTFWEKIKALVGAIPVVLSPRAIAFGASGGKISPAHERTPEEEKELTDEQIKKNAAVEGYIRHKKEELELDQDSTDLDLKHLVTLYKYIEAQRLIVTGKEAQRQIDIKLLELREKMNPMAGAEELAIIDQGWGYALGNRGITTNKNPISGFDQFTNIKLIQEQNSRPTMSMMDRLLGRVPGQKGGNESPIEPLKGDLKELTTLTGPLIGGFNAVGESISSQVIGKLHEANSIGQTFVKGMLSSIFSLATSVGAVGLMAGIGSLIPGIGTFSGIFKSLMHFDSGGMISEPVVGMGLRSGRGYTFAERGPEYVVNPNNMNPSNRGMAGGKIEVVVRGEIRNDVIYFSSVKGGKYVALGMA